MYQSLHIWSSHNNEYRVQRTFSDVTYAIQLDVEDAHFPSLLNIFNRLPPKIPSEDSIREG